MAPPLFNSVMGAAGKDPGLMQYLNAKMGAQPPMYSNIQDIASNKGNQNAAVKKRMQNQSGPSGQQNQAQSPNNNPFINMQQQQQQQDITNSRKQGY